MGGKARQAFQVVLWGAAMYASGGAWGAWAGYALAGTSTVYGAWAAREARKKAERSLENSTFPDRKVTLFGGAVAKNYIYGHAYTGGVVVGARSPVSEADPYFWLVLALPIAHKIFGYHSIMFGDHNLMPLAANGDVAAGHFHRNYVEGHTFTGIVPPSLIIDLPPKPGHFGEPIYVLGPMEGEQITAVTQQPNAPPPVIVTGEDTWQDQQYTPQTITVTRLPGIGTAYHPTAIILNGATPGHYFTITYKYQYSRSFIKAWAYLGTDDQEADPNFVHATRNAGLFEQKWTTSDRLVGIPHVVFRFHVDQDVFPNGLEPISFLVYGKELFDPRNGVTSFNSNPIKAIRDYLLTEFKADPLETDESGHIHGQIGVCDEWVDLPPGAPNQHPTGSAQFPRQERYRCDIALSTENTPMDNLGLLLTTCDGAVVPSGGYLDIWAGHFPDPKLILEDSDFVSFPEISKGMSRPELFNSIRARHPNDQKPWWPTEDCQPYSNRQYALADNGGVEPPRYIWREVDLPGTRDPWMAHRIIKQMLHRARNGLRISGTLNTRAIPLAPEQTFWYKIRSAGMHNKIFRVKKWKALPNGRVELEAQEDAPVLYEPSWEATWDPTPNTTLPDYRIVPQLVGLSARSDLDVALLGLNGDVTAQMQITWNPVTDPLAMAKGYIQLRYKRAIETEWTVIPNLPITQTEYRVPIKRGELLLFEGRIFNGMVHGMWTSNSHLANDAPTPHIVGNLLNNARFAYRNQWTDFTTLEYIYDGWFGPFGVGNVELIPYRAATGGAGTVDPNNPGIVYWLENDWEAPPVAWLESARVPVVPNTRMVAYVYGFSFFTELRIDVVWFNNAGQEILKPDGSSARWTSDSLPRGAWNGPGVKFQPEGPGDLAIFGGFMQTPANAATAAFTFISWRPSNLTSSIRAWPILWRPYLGRASVGQVVYPPWSASG